MPPSIRVAIVGDEAPFAASLARAGSQTRAFAGEMTASSNLIVEQAQRQIAVALKHREALKSLYAEYASVARAAVKGSDTQVVANKLARDSAVKLGLAYKAVGDEAVASARKAAAASRESGFTRGFASRTTGVGGMFAGPGFIAGALGGVVIDKSIRTMIELQAAVDRVRVAAQNSGFAWKTWGGQINATVASISRQSEFMKTDVYDAFNRFLILTKSVTKATQDTTLATGIARQYHLDLATAMTVVLRAQEGMVGSLRRLGIDIPKVTTNVDALKLKLADLAAQHLHVSAAEKAHAEALAKAADKAATAAGAIQFLTDKTKGSDAAFARMTEGHLAAFHLKLQELEISIGKVLLPVMDRVVARLDVWITKLQKSGQAQRDVKEIVQLSRAAFAALGAVLPPVWHGLDAIAKAVGGWKTAFEIVLSGFLALKLAKVALSIRATATAMTVAVGEAGALRLAFLGMLGPIGLATAALYGFTKLMDHIFPAKTVPLSQLNTLPAWAQKQILAQMTPAQRKAYEAGQLGSPLATPGPAGAVFGGAAGANTLPSSFQATHQTMGLAGFPAVDIFRAPGTVIGSPVDGVVVRLSGRPFSAGWSNGPGSAIGLSIYIQADNGDTYFLTHFGTVLVHPGQKVRRGQPIGTVGPMVGVSPHIHEGKHSGVYTVAGGTSAGGGSAAATAALTGTATAGKPKAPPIIPLAFQTLIAKDKGAAARGGTAALHKEIADELALIDVLKQAEATASPKRKAEIERAITAAKKDIASIRAKLAKEAKAEAAHQSLVNILVADLGGVGPGGIDAATYRKFEHDTDAQLRALISRAKAQMRAMAAQAKRDLAAQHEGKSLGDEMLKMLLSIDPATVIDISGRLGETIKTETVAQLMKELRDLETKLLHATGAAKQRILVQIQGLTASVQSAMATAGAAASAALSKVQTAVIKQYDAETQAHLKQMADQLQSQLDAIDQQLQAQVDSINAKLTAKLAQIEARRAALTPAERALQQLQAQHDAQVAAQTLTDAQAALAAAQLTKDPQQIAAAQAALDQVLYDEKVAALQAQAAIERAAADKIAADQSAAAQSAAQNEITAAQKAADAKKKALQDAYDAAVTAYQNERDAYEQNLLDMFTAYQNYLNDKNAATEQAAIDLYNWFLAHPEYGPPPFGNPVTGPPAPSVIPSGYDVGGNIVTPPTMPGAVMAGGGAGIVRRPTLFLAGDAGPEAYSFTPISAGGWGSGSRSGGDVHYHIYENGVYLEESISTQRRIARAVEPHLGRIVKAK